MKIKDGFLLREVVGSYVVVAVGARTKSFNGVIKLNETGAFLWKQMLNASDKEALVSALTQEYDVDAKTAEADVEAFVNTLLEADVLET